MAYLKREKKGGGTGYKLEAQTSYALERDGGKHVFTRRHVRGEVLGRGVVVFTDQDEFRSRYLHDCQLLSTREENNGLKMKREGVKSVDGSKLKSLAIKDGAFCEEELVAWASEKTHRGNY